MIRNIHLYGQLAEKCGSGPFKYDAYDMQDVISGLSAIIPSFRKDLLESTEYTIIKATGEHKDVLTEQDIALPLGNADTIHIIPNVKGSGFEIAAAVMLTAAEASAAAAAGGLIAAGFYGTVMVGILINVGIALAVGALAQMLAPTPKAGSQGTGRAEDHQSFLFSGAVNVVEQGGPVPLVYGQFRTGTTVISVGVTTEDIA